MAPDNSIALIPVAIVGIVFVSLAVVAITTVAIVFFTLHRQRMRTRELGYQLVTELLDRGVPSEQIAEILAAWQQNKELAQRLVEQRKASRHADIVEKLPFDPGVRAKKPAIR